MYNSQTVADRIKKAAKDKNLKLKTMLSDLQLGINLISQIANGSSVTASNLSKIADYLDCSVDYLLGRTDDPNAHREAPPALANELLTAYRAKPEMQSAVNSLLGITASPSLADDMARTIAAGESVYGKTRTTDAK